MKFLIMISPQNSLGLRTNVIRCPAYDIIKMSYEVLQRRDDAVILFEHDLRAKRLAFVARVMLRRNDSLRCLGDVDFPETHQREVTERRH